MPKKTIWRILALGVGIIVIVVVIGLILVDPVVKSQIEKRGTRAVGARVELAQADVSFWPLGVTLTDLQVTNPSAPMTNALRVARIAANLELGPLLQRKIIIDEMALERIRLNTPRATSGAVPGSGTEKKAAGSGAAQDCRGIKLPILGAPDVAGVVDQARLASMSRLETVQAQIDSQQTEWQKKLQTLPGPEEFEAYRRRIEKLTSGNRSSVAGLLAAPAEIQSLQKDLQRDLDLLKTAQKTLDGEISGVKSRVEDAKRLMTQDIETLVAKYGLEGADLKNISRALLGNAYCGWVTQALDWYARIKPLLESPPGSPGGEADTPAKQSGSVLPDFLIRKASASVELKSGTVTGELKNITSDQPRFGLPTAFYLAGEKLKGIKLIQINGVLDHVQPSKVKDTVDMVVRGLALENFTVPTGDGLPVTVERALAEIRLQSSFSGKIIDAVLNTGLQNAVIAVTPAGEKGPIGKTISRILQDLRQVDIAAMVNGTLDDYTLRISSGLDKVLAPAISQAVREQSDALRQKLSTHLDARMKPVLSAVQNKLTGFTAIQNELASRLDLGQELTRGIKRPF